MSARNLPPAEELYARAAEAGIHHIELDTPFGVGAVNTYLIQDDPLTLVDCGPNSATALGQLEDRLAELGHDLTDLDLIIVTHQHIDHTGLAGYLAARSGADLASYGPLAPVLRRWYEHSDANDDAQLQLMLRHGVEPHVAEALRAVARVVRAYGAPAPAGVELNAGDTIALRDRRFEVFFRPGHSPSDIVLVDHASRIGFSGDHLLSAVSSNAVLELPLGAWDGTRPEPLLDYRESLRQTAELGIDLALTGHGRPVLDHAELIGRRLKDQERRAESFYELLADGPLSAHEIAAARWGQVAVTQAFLTLSEVLGHLGLLIAEGRVAEDRSSEVITFRQL